MQTLQVIKKKNKKLTMNFNDDVGKELTSPSIDLARDFAEIGIDTLITDELLQKLPIIKSVVAFAKTGFAIKERAFAKKFLVFLKEFHENQVNETRLAEFRVRFDNEAEYREKILETIVVTIDRIYGNLKPRILANLLNAHLDEKVTWDEFLSLNQSLDKLHTIGIKNFKRAFEFKHDSRVLVGDLENVFPYVISAGLGVMYGEKFEISKLGRKLYMYGIQPLNNKNGR